MKKSLKFLSAAKVTTSLAVLLMAGSAFAEVSKAGPYVRADAGYSLAGKPNKKDYTKKLKGTPMYGIGFGYNINNNFRTDLTISHRNKYSYKAKDVKQDFSSTAFMLNGYYDVMEYANFTPYVMAGAGVAHNKAGDYVNSTSSTFMGREQNSLAWQGGVGIKYKITNKASLDLGYKYVNLGKFKTSNFHWHGQDSSKLSSNAIKGGLKAQEVTLGLIYNL